MSASFRVCRARTCILLPPFLLPLLALAALLWFTEAAQAAADATCATSGPGTYAVTVCIDTPAGITLSGNALVSATVSITPSATTNAKVIFYLDNKYLLTDYEAPYAFQLPTAEFPPYPSGSHSISVTAYLRDGFEAAAPIINRTFTNAGAPDHGPPFTPHTVPAPPAGESVILAVTGDGAGGETPYIQTVQLIESWNPDLVLYAGDVYEAGSYTEFLNWYGTPGPAGTYLGRLYDITNPIVGNHEYLTLTPQKAAGYFQYWNNIPNYYSYDAAGWRFIALNSTAEFGQVGPNKPQFEWLQSQVAANTNPCTIAYFHHPVVSVGPQEGDEVALGELWSLLASDGVDMVFVGHDHSYQRWKPLNSSLNVSTTGITQFVMGNGGHGIQAFIKSDNRMAVGFDDPTNSVGALRVKLNPKGAEFALFNVMGELLDQGVVPCTGATDTAAPTTPQNLAVSFAPSGYNQLIWDEAWDETGVASYAIYRNGSEIATVGGSETGYLDTGAPFHSTFVYTVAAVDPFGKTSLESGAVSITRPAQGTLTLTPAADTYVEDGKSTPFGHLDHMRIRPAGADQTVQQAYLRFDVQGTEGHITGATLRLWKLSVPSQGFDIKAVSNNTWLEETTVYTNSPALGGVVTSAPAQSGAGWRAANVSTQVQDDGPISFGLTSNAAVRLTSREGENPPELVITVDAPAPPAPTAPNLQATAPAPGRIVLTWSAATSSNGVESYTVRRNGADLITLNGDRRAYTDTAVTPATTYTYAVVATDYNGAASQPSNNVTIKTLTTPPEPIDPITFTPAADAYVSGPAPGQNFGTSAVLRADAAPERVAYLRFDLQGLTGAITRARLRLYATGGSAEGYTVHPMAAGDWPENGITHANHPGYTADGLSSSKNFAAGSWTEVDVTALIKGEGTLNLAVTGASDVGLAFYSRSGQISPQLVIDQIVQLEAAPGTAAGEMVSPTAPDQAAADADDDGVPDNVEALNGTNPNAPDTDEDGLPDLWEIESGLSPISGAGADGAGGNPDNDNALNAAEHQADTDPFDATSNPAFPNLLRLYLPLVGKQR